MVGLGPVRLDDIAAEPPRPIVHRPICRYTGYRLSEPRPVRPILPDSAAPMPVYRGAHQVRWTVAARTAKGISLRSRSRDRVR